MKFLFLLILLSPSDVQVFFKPQRISNHFGREITNIKKVKIVPVKERLSLSKPIKSKGVAKIQPNKYKKGINIIVDNNFGLKKNNLRYFFSISLKKIFILWIVIFLYYYSFVQPEFFTHLILSDYSFIW